ncbi:MAG: choice-of-anchor D domain-containing protein [Deltaproteobacteria bacterium]|nr:choice-of-anchor D domain-containing protein [Deltaproteobacteria bacterium]
MKIIRLAFSHVRAVPLFLLPVLLLFQAAASRAEWVVQSVDRPDNVGRYSSVAVDRDNRVHISYFSDTHGELKYAKKDANTPWVTATLDSRGETGLYTSLAVGNYAHISYYSANSTKLHYAENPGGVWRTDEVEAAHDVGNFTSLAVDANEKIHISYYDAYARSLKYATNQSGTWQVTLVENSGAGERSSIGLDSNGGVHIAYYDGVQKRLRYAYKDSAGWHASTLDGTYDVGSSAALAVGSDNSIHVCYLDAGARTLKYATKTGTGGWQLAVVDGSGTVGGHIAAAVDANNKVHVSYYDATNRDLRYVTNLSGTWTSAAVDAQGDVGQYTSIAVGRDRSLHISFYDVTEGDLKYAFNRDPIVTAQPNSLTFEATYVGSSSASQTVTVSNLGPGSLVIGAVAKNGAAAAEFPVADDGCSNRTLVTLESCTVSVYFAPVSAGIKSANLVIPSNDPANPSLGVPLSSTALPVYHIAASAGPGGSISPSGSVPVNQGATQTFAIVPDAGFYVASLLVDGMPVPNAERYDFLVVSADHAIEVTFASAVRLMGATPVYYPSLLAAYAAIDGTGNLQHKAVDVTGDLTLDRPISVYLQGGFNFDYTTQDGFTRLSGSLVVREGTLQVDNLEIR